MLNVIVVADFPLEKTGIMSNVVGLLSPLESSSYRLYSDQAISVAGVRADPLRNRGPADKTIIFTHLEYKGLRRLVENLADATVHVGDWPGIYWHSVCKSGNWAKGILATIRFRYRLLGLSRETKLVFVSDADTKAAIANGFSASRHVPIGINPPSVAKRESICTSEVCFSGNFRYEPNRLAALALIKRFQDVENIKLVFVGYFADDLREFDATIELHDNVPSVADFLATRRPIYVSLVSIGAGAKNKILDAALAGCPIVCTPESLDASVYNLSSVQMISDEREVEEKCLNIIHNTAVWNQITDKVAEELESMRSWKAISNFMFREVLR